MTDYRQRSVAAMTIEGVNSEAVAAAAEREVWAAGLTRLAHGPLELCAQFPQIAQRFEAWWNQALVDRPLFLGAVGTNPARPVTRRLELLDEPQRWLEEKKRDMLEVHRVGESLPHVRADFGPVMLGALLGGKTEIGSDTTWTHPFINDDWSNEPSWELNENHPWWKRVRELVRMTAEDSKGRYLVCTPDLGGSADVLLNLRGSEPLCMDVVDRPARVKAAVDAIYPAWRRAWTELYRITHEQGAGLIHWLGVWSNRPYMIPACDFSYMTGPAEFEKLLLPEIARQAATAGRAVFHLDGPGAARHIDALLEVPAIQAIQYTPGSGTPEAVRYLPMYKKIQGKGRSLYLYVLKSDIAVLLRELSPERVLLHVCDVGSRAELDEVFGAVCRRFGAKG